jgi:Zn-dependent protease with chaperone function
MAGGYTPQQEAGPPFSPVDRETFYAAIERHRRAAWRVTAACSAAVAVLAIVVAILMAPLLYCSIGLALDALNFVTPTPDLLGGLGRQIDTLSEAPTVDVALLVRTGLILAAPGVVLMTIAAYALRRVWTTSPLFTGGDLAGRPPDRTILAEARLANVVEEMAIAAGIAPPRVLIVAGGFNAAACGADETHVTLLVGEALAANVTRGSLEGMIAHLIASVANGDMPIGVRVTTTLSLFGLLARVGSSFTDQQAMAYAMKLWRVFVRPKSGETLALLTTLTEPFQDATPRDRTAQAAARATNTLTWREWLVMPLMGPVLLTGFLSGLVSQMFLEPLIALAWRQRKYMADATAVQLTRNPDALAGALAAIVDSPTAITPWTAHLAVADPRGHSGPFGRSIVPIFPSPQKRVAALTRMGAHVSLQARPSMPWPLAVVGAALIAIVAALMSVVVFLLVMVSTAISGLFTIFPAAALHFLLRWAAR